MLWWLCNEERNLSDEFLADIRGMPRRKHNLVQSRSFSLLLEQALRKYQNRAIETAQVVEELIQLAKDLRAAGARGEKLGLSEDELAFYDALEVNDSAVEVLGDDTLKKIARELVDTVRKNVTIDWAIRETVQAYLRVLVKRILQKLAILRTNRRGQPRLFWSKLRCCRRRGWLHENTPSGNAGDYLLIDLRNSISDIQPGLMLGNGDLLFLESPMCRLR